MVVHSSVCSFASNKGQESPVGVIGGLVGWLNLLIWEPLYRWFFVYEAMLKFLICFLLIHLDFYSHIFNPNKLTFNPLNHYWVTSWLHSIAELNLSHELPNYKSHLHFCSLFSLTTQSHVICIYCKKLYSTVNMGCFQMQKEKNHLLYHSKKQTKKTKNHLLCPPPLIFFFFWNLDGLIILLETATLPWSICLLVCFNSYYWPSFAGYHSNGQDLPYL